MGQIGFVCDMVLFKNAFLKGIILKNYVSDVSESISSLSVSLYTELSDHSDMFPGERYRAEQGKVQPTHCSPTCGGQMYRHAHRAPFRVQKVDLNKTQLMLLFSLSGPPSLTHLFRLFFTNPLAPFDPWHGAHTFSSLPLLLFCSERVYVWQISGEQVKYKSIVVLTSHSLWFPFGLMPCNQSLLVSPPSLSFLFIVLILDMFTKPCEVPRDEDWINVMCFTNTLMHIKDIYSNHLSLVFIMPCIKLTYSFNDYMSRLSEYCCWQFAAAALWGDGNEFLLALFFHLQSYQLDQWNRLMWTCVLLANSLLQGTIAHVHTEQARENVCFKSQADKAVCGIYKTFNLSLMQRNVCLSQSVSNWHL